MYKLVQEGLTVNRVLIKKKTQLLLLYRDLLEGFHFLILLVMIPKAFPILLHCDKNKCKFSIVFCKKGTYSIAVLNDVGGLTGNSISVEGLFGGRDA